jgi:O-succinylbenzoic acid--CoA ligase
MHNSMNTTDQIPAIIDGDTTLTHQELHAAVASAAAQLREHGITADERVGLCLAPDWRYLVLILALIHERAVACPLNTYLPPEAIAAYLGQIQSTKLIAAPSAAGAAKLHHMDVIDPSSFIVHHSSLTTPPSSFIVHRSSFPQDQPATIVFTSGSVGRPKAVLHTFGNHRFNALGSHANIPFGPGDRWLLSLPLYHVSGLSILFRMLVGSATVVLPPQRSDTAGAILEHGITHASLVSTQLIRLLSSENGQQALRQLKAILLGGSAMPHATLNKAYAFGLPIHTSYGLTEMASQVTTTPPNVPHSKRFTAGKLLPYRQIKIADDGQILVRGETRFTGYVDGAMLLQPFDGDGWYPTGDLGMLDEDGYLTVIGRKDNMFISGGENIQPEEIEAALLQIDGIEQALVVPVPNAEFGFRPVAFVKTARTMDEANIVALLAERLPRFKLPVALYPWPEQPSASGIKASRAQFRQLTLGRRLSDDVG